MNWGWGWTHFSPLQEAKGRACVVLPENSESWSHGCPAEAEAGEDTVPIGNTAQTLACLGRGHPLFPPALQSVADASNQESASRDPR